MKTVAVLDIGSTSVGGALVGEGKRADTGAPCPELGYATRHAVTFGEHVDLQRFLNGIEKSLKATLDDVVKQKSRPQRVACFLSSPFCAAVSEHIRTRTPAPVTVTPQFTANMVREHLARRAESKEQTILESRLARIRLNGYLVAAPYGQRATDIELSHFVSLADKKLVQRLHSQVAGAFPGAQIDFHTFIYAFFATVKALFPEVPHLLLVDVGGEITEVSLIWDGAIAGTVSFPFGTHTVLRRAAKSFGTTPAQVLSGLVVHLAGETHTQTAARWERVLAEIEAEWAEAVTTALPTILDHHLLPRELFLMVQPELAPLFRRWCATPALEKLTFDNKRFTITFIEPNMVGHFCQLAAPVQFDVPLVIEALFCDTIQHVR